MKALCPSVKGGSCQCCVRNFKQVGLGTNSQTLKCFLSLSLSVCLCLTERKQADEPRETERREKRGEKRTKREERNKEDKPSGQYQKRSFCGSASGPPSTPQAIGNPYTKALNWSRARRRPIPPTVLLCPGRTDIRKTR